MAPARWALLPLLPVTKALLNCSEAHDPVTAVCCTAQDAWDGLVAEGGCGGSGPTENQCNAAMELCRDCQRAVQDFSIAEDSDVAVDLSSAKVTCELPQWTPCGGTVRGLGVGLLIATGVALLLVASAACVAFDWRLLPSLVAKQRRKLLVEDIHAQDKGEVLEPEGRADSAPAPPRPVPPAPPTPTARPPQGFDGLRAAADGDAPAESPAMAAMSPQDQIIGAGEPETVKAPPRPRHYASAYALHKAFMVIACIAVVLRVSYIVARVLLVVGLSLAYQCLPELLLCILPLVWVACTSRRPKSSTIAIPASVAYWGPWGALPRFTTYAVCTICTEIYSTLVAALAVARMPCNSSPLAGVLLYCIGLLVAVVRAYCAVLALRLQDELASMCRRVLPREKAAWGNAGNTKAMDQNQKRWQGLGFFGSREVIEDTVRDFNEPDDPSKAALACPFLPEFLCPVLRRRLVGRRILAGREPNSHVPGCPQAGDAP
ncbi:unnamed protein product [Effrenium voratum]|nr:unnamed protein product [Effrenium voratum]